MAIKQSLVLLSYCVSLVQHCAFAFPVSLFIDDISGNVKVDTLGRWCAACQISEH